MNNKTTITKLAITALLTLTTLAQAYPQYGDHHPNIGGLLPTVITQNSTFDPLQDVLAYDIHDGYLTNITITGSVNTAVPGQYNLTYSVTNSSNDTKTITRKITVIPAGTFAQPATTGRTGPHNIITLDNTYQNTLATNLTFIKPIVNAIEGTTQQFKLIERNWDDTDYTNTPPTAAQWDTKKPKPFWHDLYLTIRPRQDRWIKIILTNNNRTNQWIYGLAGDPGIQFHSDLLNKDYYRLSREVDDPQTCGEQFTNAYAHGLAFEAPVKPGILREMGCHALAPTFYKLQQSYDGVQKKELYGFYLTVRSFLKSASKTSGSASNWAKIEQVWDHTLTRGMNCTYRRSYEIFFSEVKISNYMDNTRRILHRLRTDYNPKRIYVGCSNTGSYRNYIDDTTKPHHTNNGTNDYFSFEWHKGHFNKMFDSFPGIGNDWPGYSQYPRINEIFDASAALNTYKEHRSLHKLAINNHIEAAIFDKCGFTKRLDNDEWGPFALPFYAMWFNYDGFDYLNNGHYFKDDWDGDGLSNADEKIHGTNPFNADTDGDLLFDNHEIQFGLDPLDPTDANADADGDRISNFNEINSTLSWQYTQMDENGNSPILDPHDPSDGTNDSDQDLFPYWYELTSGLNIADIHVKKDSRKGAFYWWLDATQFVRKLIATDDYTLDLQTADHDNDGINNNIEVKNGLNPRNPADANEDWDNDGTNNSAEIANATSLIGDYTEGPRFDQQLLRGPTPAIQAIDTPPLHTSATRPEINQTFTFTKLSGPAWLTINQNGTLSGRPAISDKGSNTWQVKVTDNTGRADTNTLHIQVTAPLNTPEISLTCNTSPIPGNAITTTPTDFGTTTSDDYTEKIFTITNKGYADLTITNITTTGNNFHIINPPAAPIPYNTTATFTIRFQPQPEAPLGNTTETIKITSNDQQQNPFEFNTKGKIAMGTQYTPCAISNCILWLDAADIDADGTPENLTENTITNSPAITAWNDKSGHNNNAIQNTTALQPTLQLNQLGNLPTIHFDGTDDTLTFNTITNIRTVIWVLKETPDSLNDLNFLLGDTTRTDFHRGTGHRFWGSSASTAVTQGKTRLNGSTINGNTKIPQNQYCIISTVTTTNTTASTLSKDRANTDRSWDGNIAEIIIYDRPLSHAETKTIRTYINNKWHINTPPPTNYNAWVTNYNLGTQTNRYDDPDHDGINNLAEFATGTDPSQNTPPKLRIRKHHDNPHKYDIIYPRRKHHAQLGLHYILESSTNLLDATDWHSNTTIRTGTGSQSSQIESITNIPLNNIKHAQFFRIKIKSDN